jgi:xanthine dehydrogenase accessory factor
MRDVLAAIRKWQAEGQRVALATVVKTRGSTPRQEGARLAVSSTGEMAGSVSGGCVESDVILQAQEVLKADTPRLVRYAITDDMVWDVGLACGGTVEVWIEPLVEADGDEAPMTPPRLQAELESALDEDRLVTQAILLSGSGDPGAKLLVWPSGEASGSLGDKGLDRQVAAAALAIMSRPRAETREYTQPVARVFIEVVLPPPHLIIFGAVHIAMPLTSIAKTLGYRVTIADPRKQFANRDRFPQADQIIPEWPQKALEKIEIGPSTYCAILTHDPKIDEPALLSLLGKGAGYIGAIGSRRTHAERFERLARQGVGPDQLAEVYAPIGLNLGAKTAEEIALSIMAEIVAVRREAPAGFMRENPWCPPWRIQETATYLCQRPSSEATPG